MIYLDSSVVLARLFVEPKRPSDGFWLQPFTSSRLLAYEVYVRVHARGLWSTRGTEAEALMNRLVLMDLSEPILTRALKPFPVSVRTLDGLHLASMDYLRAHGQTVELASYDTRLASAAAALGFAVTKI